MDKHGQSSYERHVRPDSLHAEILAVLTLTRAHFPDEEMRACITLNKKLVFRERTNVRMGRKGKR